MWLLLVCISSQTSLIYGLDGSDFLIAHEVPSTTFRCQDQQWAGYYSDPQVDCQMFHICVHRNDKIDQFSFMCPNQTVFDQKLLVCVWLDNFDCSSAPSFYYVNEGVFEDLGNDFESPESRSEGRSLGLEGIGPEAEDLPLTEVENDISTLGKSLTYDNTLETPNIPGIIKEAKPQEVDKALTDDQILPNLSHSHAGEFNLRPTPKDKKLYSTTATTKASSANVKTGSRKVNTQKEIRKKPKSDSKFWEKLDPKHKENTLDIRKTTEYISVTSNQPSLQTKRPILPNKSPSTYPTSSAKGKELDAEIKPIQQQTQDTETATKPYLSLTNSPPESRKKSFGQILPNKKSINRLTTQLTHGNIWEKASEITTKQPPENIQSRTTLKVPTQLLSVGENSFPQSKPRVTTNLPLTENKKSSLTTRPKSTNVSQNNFNTKLRTGINKSNVGPHRSRAKSTTDLKVNDQNKKSNMTPRQLRFRVRQGSKFTFPPQRPLKEKVSSSPRDKSVHNLISQHKTDSAGVQKAFSSPISFKDTKQITPRGKKKDFFKTPTDHTKSLLINKTKQTANIQRPSTIVRGISKSVDEKIESDNNKKVTNKKQGTDTQRNNENYLRQPIKVNTNNQRQNYIQKISRSRPKLTVQKALNPGVKSPSIGLTAYGILQQLLQNVTIIRSKALTEADPSSRGRNIRRNRTANFSNAKSFDTRSDQAATPRQNVETGDSEGRFRSNQNTQNGKSNDLSLTKAALYQAEGKGYLPLEIQTEENAKNVRLPLEPCAFDQHGNNKPLGCIPKTSKQKNNTDIFANQGFEIPVPSNKNLYSKLPYGGTSKVQINGRLPYLKVEKASSLNTGTEKHKILNIPGNGVPPISLYDHNNNKRHDKYLLPPPLKSLTSSEEEAPVLIVSRADAQSNGRAQKVYLNTIKSDVKKNANQERFGASLNLHLPEPANSSPPAVPKEQISWAHYVTTNKTNSGRSLKE